MNQFDFFELPILEPHARKKATINPENIGWSSHPLFCRYHSMIGRCHNKHHSQFRNYGAYGITVCDEWRNGFPYFLEDMGDSWPGRGYEIDRINPNGPYCKENCRWLLKSYNVGRANHARTGIRYQRRHRS